MIEKRKKSEDSKKESYGFLVNLKMCLIHKENPHLNFPKPHCGFFRSKTCIQLTDVSQSKIQGYF